MFKMRKVVIVGAGHVGSHVALNLVQSGEADDIVLIDILREKAAGQALDLDDAISASLCHKDATVRAGSYAERCRHIGDCLWTGDLQGGNQAGYV